MNKILLFDTSVLSRNMGDYIIMDAVTNQIREIFSGSMVFHSLTHDKINKSTYALNKLCDFNFIGGTNLLSSNMNSYNQWKINLFDSLFIKNVILMGVGWWQYQEKPNFYTKTLLKRVLNPNLIHSVRDSYTELMLKEIGFDNVLNTGCMTMWGLTESHCDKIPNFKGDDVIFTLTDYNKNPSADLALINCLTNNYKKVFFWPQGDADLKYFLDIISTNSIEILGGNLYDFDKLLSSHNSLDYVGTRLHAGIRALQNKRRSIIVGIDNRASEKSKDFNLVVVDRCDIKKLENTINISFRTNIKLNTKNIQRWKQQFNESQYC